MTTSRFISLGVSIADRCFGNRCVLGPAIHLSSGAILGCRNTKRLVIAAQALIYITFRPCNFCHSLLNGSTLCLLAPLPYCCADQLLLTFHLLSSFSLSLPLSLPDPDPLPTLPPLLHTHYPLQRHLPLRIPLCQQHPVRAPPPRQRPRRAAPPQRHPHEHAR